MPSPNDRKGKRIVRGGITVVVMAPPGNDWLRVGEASRLYDCPRTTIHYLARAGAIRKSKPPHGVTRYNHDDIAAHFGYPRIETKE